MSGKPVRLDIYRTAISMRSFEHAAASRDLAEAVIVRLEFDDGTSGWGETLPRDYVTGETLDSVIRDITEIFWPICRTGLDMSDGLEGLKALPTVAADSRPVPAARCAVELAWAWRHLRRPPRGAIFPRVSGVLGASDPARTAWRLRGMRLYGLRDFKLKLGLGDDVDAENLRIVHGKLRGAIGRRRCTLRVDVNGGWDADSAPERVAALKPFGVCAVEQPTYCSAGEFLDLARRCRLPLMADESLVTPADALTLLVEPDRIWWNIRLSKNGGLGPSLEMARLAAEHRVRTIFGCMVGESCILSAMQRVALQMGIRPRFVEGNYGRFLLSDDLSGRSLRFGWGGRLGVLRSLDRYAPTPERLCRYGTGVTSLEA